MSGTPKHTHVVLNPALERQIREQAEAARAAAAAQRRELEEQRRAARLSEKKGETASVARQSSSSLSALERGELAVFLDPKESARLRSALHAQSKAVEAAVNVDALTGVARELKALERAIDEFRSAAQRERLRQQKAETAQVVANLATVIREGDAQLSRKFDAAGFDAVVALQAKAEAALAKEKLEQAEKLAAQAHERLATHRTRTQEQHGRWLAQRNAADESIRQLEDALAAAREDQVLARWRTAELSAVEQSTRLLATDLADESFEMASRGARAGALRLGEILDAAKEDERREVARARIMQSYREALEELDFIVEDVGLEHPADPRSRHILEARLRTGEVLAMGLPHDGTVSYELEGFPMRDGEEDGIEIHTCSEATDQLGKLHELLLKRGVQTDGLHWSGKPKGELILKREESVRRQSARSQEKDR